MDAYTDTEQECLRLAVALYNLRRKRDEASEMKALFGEPGWDILLDLYIAQCRRMEIQVSSVCLDAGVPSTTILRWIARLEKEGLIYRIADNADARRRYVRLTQEGHEMMRRILGELSRSAPSGVV
ncbi:MarR family transcriptional regulator [Novosphingobium sp. B1]|uniref:MarR family transcriptional regulator n=1 Tax=Novosphingobium sp. B1 TaxID=1938756 RepID=UPI0009D830DF|nr:MarR family transcriptional regulator [Novosphingobium sp. B1]SMC86380.1 DNA-binding transcriptional regulator, MarR family [Novosphingobium sp. B1]